MFANDEVGITTMSSEAKSAGPSLARRTRARVLVVVFTMRDELVRTVTAYEASGRMRMEYFATKGQ